MTKTAMLLLVALSSVQGARWGEASARTLKTIYSFCAQATCSDGLAPAGPLAMDLQGDLFGVTYEGGQRRLGGVVYGLFQTPGTGTWIYAELYRFCHVGNCHGGSLPTSNLVVDTSGNLYGVTEDGGTGGGTVFELMPTAGHGEWTFKRLHAFCGDADCTDGKLPLAGLTYAGAASGALYDGVSPLYGTTEEGGAQRQGVVYQLTPNSAGKSSESIIYSFCPTGNCTDGAFPVAPVIVDATGNLFGTTELGGAHADNMGHGGTVFELARGAGGTWTQSVLYSFNALPNGADGYSPFAAVWMDQTGDLYGTTTFGGGNIQGGVAFKLTPADPVWQETVLNNFCVEANCTDGRFPQTSLMMDGSGHLIGATINGGTNPGPQNLGGGTIYTLNGSAQVIYDFCSKRRCKDGAYPNGPLVMDGAGNLFGTTGAGGAHKKGVGAGTVFELGP